MLVPGDLGFTGLVLVFLLFFFFGPIVSFLIQKKWRIAVEKKEEIMRLVAMASEEAERVEFETSGGYEEVVAVAAKPFKCAVCYCHTTTRCSRCKVVRYCSGKCQIIHWRRGHKEECHPPSNITTHWNGSGSDSDPNILLQGEQYKFYGNDLEMESRWDNKPTKRFSKRSPYKFSFSPDSTSGREDEEVEYLMDDKGADINSTFSDSSRLRFSTSTTSNGSLVNEVPICDSLSRSNMPPYDDNSLDVVDDTIGASDINSHPPEFIGSDTSTNSIYFSSKLKPKTSSSRAGVSICKSTKYSGSCINGLDACTLPETFPCSSDFSETNLNINSSVNESGDNGIMTTEGDDDVSPDLRFLPSFPVFNAQSLENDDAHPENFGNRRPAARVTPSEKMTKNASTIEVLPAKPSGPSDCIYTNHNNDQLLESKGRRFLSSIASERHSCCGARRSSTSNVKTLKVDNIQTMHTGLSQIASYLPNASSGLKTSVQKVVQQFRVPKPSKHNPFALGEVAERNNYKMLFPYDLFLKLYNWAKVDLLPCGLMNCGNSCYANAVLQCLAFTQPLTAYFLQGLHSRACPRKEWCFTCEFECLIQRASEGNSPLSPVGILSQLQSIGSHLGHGKEEDAHEFLRYAIDTMQSVCLKEAGVFALSPLAEETTIVGLIFGGYLRSKIKCMKCHGKSERHERMMDLTVEIQGDIGTLEEALGKFTATEILDGENKYLCSRCKSYEKAKKKFTVLEAPNVLTIAFKRFQSGKYGKLNKSIRFPEILNLAPYMSGKSDKSHIYRLYGVVVHEDVKNASFSGHYVCYVKNLQGKWFKIDDSTVKPVALERVLSKGAYMLLYSRCSPQPPSFIRNAMMANGTKIKRERSSEAISTSNCTKDTTTRERFSTAALRADTFTSTAHRRPESYPHQMTSDGHSSFESLNPFNRRLHQIHRVPVVDSSSDSSSLFSCSDAGSCSTESTRDSISTDDLSDYIFGESWLGYNSPWRGSDDSDVSCSSPLIRSSTASHRNLSAYGRHGSHNNATQVMESDSCSPMIHRKGRESPQEMERVPFLYSDASTNCGKLSDHYIISNSSSSSSSETNLEQLGWGNHPLDVKSGVSLRRPTWERTTQPFYYKV